MGVSPDFKFRDDPHDITGSQVCFQRVISILLRPWRESATSSDASVPRLAGQGAGPADTDWHRDCRATAAWGRLMTWVRSCQAGNNNPSTSFSAIAKKLKLIYGNCRAGWFKLKHFEEFFLGHLFTLFDGPSSQEWRWREDHVAILKCINQEHVKSQEHEKNSQEHKRSDKGSTQAPKGICWNLS